MMKDDPVNYAAQAIIYRKRAQRAEADNKALREVLGGVQELITSWAGVDDSRHKQWLLDEIVKVITGDNYDKWVASYNNGEDGPNTYEWDKGIAP